MNVFPTSNTDLVRGRLYLPKTRLLVKGTSFEQPGQLDEADWKALGNLTALERLGLKNMQNRFPGETFSRLAMLDRLELDDCELTPDDFRQITELKRLTRFEISDNERREYRQGLDPREDARLFAPLALAIAPGSWPQMETLRLTSVLLSDQSLAAISQMENLQSLWLANSEFDPRSLDQLADLPNLTELHLWPNNRRIDDQLVLGGNADQQTLAAWGRMKRLEILHVSSFEQLDGFGGRGQKLAKRWPSLSTLSISHSTLSPRAIREIVAMPQLTTLSLGGTTCEINAVEDIPLAGVLLQKLRGKKSTAEEYVTSLMAFDANSPIVFSGEQIDDQAMLRIVEIRGLTSLTLRDTQVTDRGIARLENHPTLKRLSVTSSPVTNRSLASILRIPSLKFSECEFKETGVNENLLQPLLWRESTGKDPGAWLTHLGVTPAVPVQPQP
ncbi:leucine-rich repeat domain-containing protein [Blastopirellula retiformator]|uniref:hypothetical protein n=1 Tax=Blastopirellula retiformator TaxID=2527970 RepID=UPI0011B38382|nr:hypothetical protein [Blastopirellula retiformator]